MIIQRPAELERNEALECIRFGITKEDYHQYQLNIKEAINQMKIQTSKEGGSLFDKPHIEEGLYDAKLKEVKEVSEGKYGKRVVFIFSIEKDKAEVELAHLCYVPEIAAPENKYGKVLQALGCELGEEIDTDTLIGKSVRVMVEDYQPEGEDAPASSITKVKTLAETVKA